MVFKLNVGDKLPSFASKDIDAIAITDQLLKGMCSVICFYSKEEIPVLEKFRDKMKQFDELCGVVLAVNPSDIDKQKTTYETHKLNFILLSDPDLSMCKAFDVLRKVEGKGKVIPSTFVIDRDGVIQWIERPIQIPGHAERALEAVNKFHL